MLTTTLHQTLTTFVGRERELAALASLLPTTRLLTITGAGGIGKTRLALQVVSVSNAQFPDGVVWVALAQVTDPALVLPTIARTLGISDSGSQTIWTSLCAYLATRRMLLVLDNFEHLRDVAPQLADLLAATKHLALLVTSREALRLAGEQIYPIPPLSLPDCTRPYSPKSLAQSEAVQLFLSRAQAVRPDFALNSTTGPVVAEICWRLDGLPLAIELTAAWVRTLPPQALLARLDANLLHLTSRIQATPDRHQTLHAAISWSYDLLDADEQQLFARLSVFAGGWTLEAAEVVCAPDLGEAAILLDRLEALLDKSLVQQPRMDGEPRFQMLMTIREYAAARMAERGEAEMMNQRHTHFFLGSAERTEPELRGAQQQVWFARLAAEHDNIRAALRWAITAGDATTALRLVGAMGRFWWIQGYLKEGRTWLTRALSMRSSQSICPMIRANALSCAGNLAAMQGDFPTAQALHEECLALRRTLDDMEAVASSLNNLGLVAEQQEDYTAAKTLYSESLALWREIGDAWGVADVLNNLGYVMAQQGDYVAARTLREESLLLKREIGDTWGIASALSNLGMIAIQQGDYTAARDFHQESLLLKQNVGNRQGIAISLEGLAQIALAVGQIEQAVQLSGAAVALRTAIGAPISPSEQAAITDIQTTARANLGEEAFRVAWTAGQALTLDEAIALALQDAPATIPKRAAPPVLHLNLTPREQEVLRLIATGLTNKEIAHRLTLSHYTVQGYVRSILGKLSVTSRSAATRYAVEHDLVAETTLN